MLRRHFPCRGKITEVKTQAPRLLRRRCLRAYLVSKVTSAHDLHTPGLTRTVLDTTEPNMLINDLTCLFALMLSTALELPCTMFDGMPPTLLPRIHKVDHQKLPKKVRTSETNIVQCSTQQTPRRAAVPTGKLWQKPGWETDGRTERTERRLPPRTRTHHKKIPKVGALARGKASYTPDSAAF